MKKKNSLSLWQVIAIALILGQCLPVLLLSWQSWQQQRAAGMAGLQNEHQRLASLLAIGLEKAVQNVDIETARLLLGAAATDPRVVRVGIADAVDRAFAGFPALEFPERRHGEVLSVSRPLYWHKDVLGKLVLELDAGYLEASLAQDFRQFLVLALLQVAFSLALTMLVLNKFFVAPVKRLLRDSAALAQRRLDAPFIWTRDDELGRLGQSLEDTRVALRRTFADIEASEQRFRSLTDLSSDWYWERDEHDALTYISHGFADITGIPVEHIIGSKRGELGNFRYEPNSWAAYRAALAAREPFRDLLWQVTRNDGEVRHGLTSGEPVFDERGEFRGYRGIGKDVTVERQAEALENSTARLRRLTEHLPEAAVYIEEGEARMNAAAERLCGYARQDLARVPAWFERLQLADGGSYALLYEADRAAGFPLPRELALRCKDGSMRRIEFSAYREEDIEVWLMHDITAREEAQAALQLALLEQNAILQHSAIGIAFVRERVVQRANRRMEEILGFPIGGLNGQSTRLWYGSEEEFSEIGRRLYPFTRSGRVFATEVELTRADGVRIWCSLHAAAIDAGKPEAGGVCVVQDISEQKSSELALLAAKTELERSLAEAEQTHREVAVLAELASYLQACPDARDAYDALRLFAPRLFPASSGALFEIAAGDLLEQKLSWGEAQGEARFQAEQCWALRRGQTFESDGSDGALCCAHLPRHGLPYACLPLTAQGKTFGLLYLAHAQPATVRQAQARTRLAGAMAEQASLALANLRLRETLRQQSIRDPLTGLFNRRHMHEVLQREMARAERGGRPLAAAIIDVDHFKKFNDTYGHDAGDHVLQSVARSLEKTVRQSDIVCRLGGEEFLVILPEADAALATRRAHDLLAGIRALQLKHGNRSLGVLTASLGLAIFPAHAEDAGTLVEAADQALYAAKKAGRDRVIVAGLDEQLANS